MGWAPSAVPLKEVVTVDVALSLGTATKKDKKVMAAAPKNVSARAATASCVCVSERKGRESIVNNNKKKDGVRVCVGSHQML